MSATKSFKMERATLEDVPALTDIWWAAFSSNPTLRLIWPDTPGVRRWWSDVFYDEISNKPFHHYVKLVDPESLDANGWPRIAAYAKWDTSTPEERGPRCPPWHEDMDSEILDAFIGRVDGERRRVMGDLRHYLTLATHPDYQRRGLGTMLMRYGCDLVDKNGVAAYVDASKSGSALYRRFGFVDESLPDSGDFASMARR
ncbi:hypothetical protein FDECE_2440 [Fusarium decemcellulare]|nr:hypothetical protein FDECE_2440 [Fusarium decemcellulare]